MSTVAELHRTQRENAGDDDDQNAGGRTLAELDEQRANGDEHVDQADDGQYFVWERGRKVSLSTLIRRGVTVEHAFVFGGKRLKGRGDLLSFDEDVYVVVRGKVGAVKLVPVRDDDEIVQKVTIETHIASKVVLPADSPEAQSIVAQLADSGN